MERNPRTVVITGASSGIGRSLALEYAAPEVVIGLLGRDAGRLEEVAFACRARGAEAVTGVVDVRDRAALAAWLGVFDRRHPVDQHRNAAFVRMETVRLIELGFHCNTFEKEWIERHIMDLRKFGKDPIKGGFVFSSPIWRCKHANQ